MDPKRDRLDGQAPEVVNPTYPEVVQYPFHNNFQYQQTQPKPDDASGTYASSNAPYPTYGSHVSSPHTYHTSTTGAHPGESPSGAGAVGRRKKKGGALCGCGALVVVLCAIIAVFAAAVIGLAAGTGVEANRANVAEAKVSSLSSALAAATKTGTATTTASSASATSTSFADLDDDCSGNALGVSGTTYDAFSLIGDQAFTIQCNADAVGDPLFSLFTSNLNTCMDACASYTSHISANFGTNSNTTCGGVSFIPLWTNKTAALAGGAPGNCYLKPTQTAAPTTPNIDTECHAGILVS